MRENIQAALRSFSSGDLTQNALNLFAALGYVSERQQPLDEKTFDGFVAAWHADTSSNLKNALTDKDWKNGYVDFLFQLTESELGGQDSPSGDNASFNDRITSYLFFVIDLTGDAYTRTALSQITREVNKVFPIPVMILFKHGPALTLAIIDRQPHKRDDNKDVLRKVTLIKDIRFADPHRAHLEILYDLALQNVRQKHDISNFLSLHQAWQKVLDTRELNKRFFKELANWYFWAVDNVTFPADEEKDAAVRNATSVIRLITRLIFVWFLKEKGLVSDKLFSPQHLKGLLHFRDRSAYYKAILQNLFFATLNSEMGTRKFIVESSGGRNSQHFVHNVFRYEREFKTPAATLRELFEPIPFLNGGLFECLDKETETGRVRVDGFSDNTKNVLRVPDELFFGEEQEIDLNQIYGTRNKKYKVRGLLNLLNSYKFTIAENTPIEEEIALDPELLGKVFENLLANYNPETRTTARKQTGSFYTPREIVNYMVDEALVAHLKTKLLTENVGFVALNSSQATFGGNDWRKDQLVLEHSLSGNRWQGHEDELEAALRELLAYNQQSHRFNETETEILIKAIDTCKILDPACGSGAFPMGILLKLVHILEKLDPDNDKWREWQEQKATEEAGNAFKIADQRERDERLKEISDVFQNNSSDYGRKLFLIENCIYGVDIQPIAIQIAKLRFFISLIVDQQFNDDPAHNRGIRPLPNLETKFVAANTLIGLETQGLKPDDVPPLEAKLKVVRAKHFGARSRETKNKYRDEDKRIRAQIAALLTQAGFPATSANQIANWNPYAQNAKADWFDAEWMFGIENGFDIVIGNPPYVRQEEIKEFKPLFSQQYECFTGTADLFVYFYERAWRSLHTQGVFCFITSNKYFRSGYGAKLRKFLSDRTAVRQLIDFGDAPIFTAIAYPSILLASKQKTPNNHVRALTWTSTEPPVGDFLNIFQKQSFLMPQKELTNEAWHLASGVTSRLLEKLRTKGKPLGEYVEGKLYNGIKTGLNEAFVVNRETRDRLIAEDKSSKEILKPFLRGRDIKRWRVEPQDLWLMFVPWHFPLHDDASIKTASSKAEKEFRNRYPAIYKHLLQFKAQLASRDKQETGIKYEWYALQRGRTEYIQQVKQDKIIIPAIERACAYAPDFDGYYTNDKTSICITPNAKFLLGLLNSSTLWWVIRNIAASKQGGFYEFKPMYVSQLPIPLATAAQQAKITGLVDKILAAKKNDAQADTRGWEAEIDALVYQLYGLAADEISLIEGGAAAQSAEALADQNGNESNSPFA